MKLFWPYFETNCYFSVPLLDAEKQTMHNIDQVRTNLIGTTQLTLFSELSRRPGSRFL